MANLETQRNLDEANRGTALKEAQAKKEAENADAAAAAKSAEELANLIHAPYQHKKEMEKLRTAARKDSALEQGKKAEEAWHNYMKEVNRGMESHGYDTFLSGGLRVLALQTKLGLALQEGFYHMTDILIAGDYVPEPLKEFAQNYIPDAIRSLPGDIASKIVDAKPGINHFTKFNNDDELVLVNLKQNKGWFEFDKDYPVSLETVLAFQAEVVGFLNKQGFEYIDGSKGEFKAKAGSECPYLFHPGQKLPYLHANHLIKTELSGYLKDRLKAHSAIEVEPIHKPPSS